MDTLNTVTFECVEYFCPSCQTKGFVSEVFINPTVVLVRGGCERCKQPSGMRAVDLLKLAERIDLPESSPEPRAWGRSRYSAEVR